MKKNFKRERRGEGEAWFGQDGWDSFAWHGVPESAGWVTLTNPFDIVSILLLMWRAPRLRRPSLYQYTEI
jgi:hypothetical protein